MGRVVQHARRGTAIDDFAFVHHKNTVGDIRDHGKVVRYQQHARAFTQTGRKHGENLRLDGHIERGSRFVGDDKRGRRGDRRRDQRALTQSARQFMRVLMDTSLRLRNSDIAHHGPYARCPLGARAQSRVQRHRLADFRANCAQRIE